MVASVISDRCGGLKPGEPLSYRGLRFIPLHGPSRQAPAYALLTPENTADVVVTEVSESGSVPLLRVRNTLNERVLLLDGQELLGAKQNRIVNLDVLVPAGRDLDVPVTCVEQGRWGYSSRTFTPGRSAFRSMRSSKSSQVYASLKASGSARSDQLDVWRSVSDLHRSLGSSSPTGAMSDAYGDQLVELATARDALAPPAGAVGFVAYSGDRFLGLELFDRASTLEQAWASIIDGYLIDWFAVQSSAARGDAVGDDGCDMPLDEVMGRLADAPWELFDSPGEGRDARWEDDTLVGAGLVWEDESVVHLHLLPKVTRAQPDRVRVVRSPAPPPAGGAPTDARCARCGFVYATVRVGDDVVCNHCRHRQPA